ncbi:hypothetical protein [Streptomyces sp. NBC_01803]|uniref:nSTAND3 domain-containing NTPase n=1 Tax=Streptomyces sp. NBC_01803 TaxID=2975946 RepID=UPI002DDA0726|nr:hypothetical protein [Streptomyces sp. NBC_01803]
MLLGSARDQMATFVVTGAYRKAAQALRDHGFVVLPGEPAVSKSVIAHYSARILSFACLIF